MENQQFSEIKEFDAQQNFVEQSSVQNQLFYAESKKVDEIGNIGKQAKKKRKTSLQLSMLAVISSVAVANVIMPDFGIAQTAELQTTNISPYSIEYVVELPENFENIEIVLSNSVIKKTTTPTEQIFTGEFTMLQPDTLYNITVSTSDVQNKTLYNKQIKTAKKEVPPSAENLIDGVISNLSYKRDYAEKKVYFTFNYIDLNNFLTDFSANLIDSEDNTVFEIPINKTVNEIFNFSFADIRSGSYTLQIIATSNKNHDKKIISICNSLRL